MTTQFRPVDCVARVRSPARSILETWKVQRIPGVVASSCRHRVELSVRSGGAEKVAIVDLENLIGDDENSDLLPWLGN